MQAVTKAAPPQPHRHHWRPSRRCTPPAASDGHSAHSIPTFPLPLPPPLPYRLPTAPRRRRRPIAPAPPDTAPPHRAYPARQRHQTRANPTNLAAPSTVHHPLPPKPPPSDAHPLRAVPPRRPPPSTPPPALSPSEQTQIDHSDRPCPRQPHLSPLVCVASLAHILCNTCPGLCSSPGGRLPSSCP